MDPTRTTPACPIAIVGMSCFFPQSAGLKAYWRLLLQGRDAITEVPPTHWSKADYFDPDPRTPDRVYCARGGFLPPIDFDPSEFGIPPASLEATDTSQLLALLAAKQALRDAGLPLEPRPHQRHPRRHRHPGAGHPPGLAPGLPPLATRARGGRNRRGPTRAGHAHDRRVLRALAGELLPRPARQRGRRAHRQPARPGRDQLRRGRRLRQLACSRAPGAARARPGPQRRRHHRRGRHVQRHLHVHVLQQDPGPLADGGRPTLLEGRGRHRPRRGHRDGGAEAARGRRARRRPRLRGHPRDRRLQRRPAQSIYAPSAEGQERALEAAYADAGVDPGTVELVEAHGTGTRVGDKVEVQALCRVLGKSPGAANRCALGSVKSRSGTPRRPPGRPG